MQEPQLSMEQQFQLRSFAVTVNKASEQEAKTFLLELYAQALMREALYRSWLSEDKLQAIEPFSFQNIK